MDAAPSVPPRPRGRTYACVSSITPIPGTFVKPEAQVGQRERKWLQLAVDASDRIGGQAKRGAARAAACGTHSHVRDENSRTRGPAEETSRDCSATSRAAPLVRLLSSASGDLSGKKLMMVFSTSSCPNTERLAIV